MGTKNNPGQYDCYAAAEPNEPLFTLLGRDPMGAALVQLWALLRHEANEDPEKVAEARACAREMHNYCVSLGKMPMPLLEVIKQATKSRSVDEWTGILFL